jgi:YYY domain-containing protein
VNTLGIFDFVLWLLVVQFLSFSVLPYIAWMSPNAPDRGYGWSKALGVFAFSGMVWLSALCGLTTDNNYLVVAIFLGFLFLGYRGYRSRWLSFQELRTILSQHALNVEGIFLGLTLFFGVIRFLNPEIFWGEKPMDSTFLNFFVRNQTLPPQDPWAAGSSMSYYYLGIYLIAALLKVSGIPAAFGYNFAMATLAGWIGSALYSLIGLLTRNRKFAAHAAWILLLASNPEVVRLSIMNLIEGKPFNFDTTFWPSTRVFTSPSFLEYTSWSLLFADLHAHVVAIPFTVIALGLASLLFIDGSTRYSARGVALRLTLGTVVGALFGINTWDFITFGGVVGVLIVLARVPLFWQPPKASDGTPILGEVILVTFFSRAVALVWDLALFGLSAALCVWLYRQGVSFRPSGGWGWVSSHEFNSITRLLRIMGYWVVGMLAVVGVLAWDRWKRGTLISVPHLLISAVLLVLVFIPGVMSVNEGRELQPWATFTYMAVLISLTYVVLWGPQTSAEEKTLGVIIAGAAAFIVVIEIFFLLDRMNTMFKGYMAVWMLSGIGTLVGGYFAYQSLCSRGSKLARRTGSFAAYILVALLVLGTSVNVFAIARLKRVPVRHYTFDGIAYLHDMNPDDAALIEWLNTHVVGTPTVLEAQGDAYREYTRVSMHTGLPTVLGWEHHSKQRGLSEQKALQRRKAIQTIYVSDDIGTVKQLLLDNKVDFIVVGAIERATYRRLNEAKFDEHPELFTKVISFGGSSLYVTYFSKFNQTYGSGISR